MQSISIVIVLKDTRLVEVEKLVKATGLEATGVTNILIDEALQARRLEAEKAANNGQ